ncbi:MAG: HigA family addiction module antitoxin [Alphaproteobacteria bacterium]
MKSSTTIHKKSPTLISRADLTAGRINLDDLVIDKIDPIHPGEVLQHDVLEPLGITAYRLAKDIKVPVNRITAIIAGKRAVTAETAMRLARYLGMSDEFWLNLQSQYDLDVARGTLERIISKEVKPRAA